LSRLQRFRKPTEPGNFCRLSDPQTLSQLGLLLKEGIYIATPDGEIVDAGSAATAEEGPQGYLTTANGSLFPAKHQSEAQVCK
jgi:hypothetical protein